MSIEGLLAGRVLGDRYLIEEVIGRGGMGAVYRATDRRLEREVAVKVITISSIDPDTRERVRARFHREARAAAALPHHPNVVPVYDFGTDDALQLDFLVMELLRGEDLATHLVRSGPPPLPAGIWILLQAARGVAVGHRAGLIHRDVKPGNVFLARSRHDEDVQIRILDFGIAKLVQEEETASQLTQDGRIPLSPAYASPEQLRGLRQITPASDIFSLGAIGFQLFTGERPFTDQDRNRMAIGMPVPMPSLRQHDPAIPPELETVVQCALAYEPTERWTNAMELAGVLEQLRRELRDQPFDPSLAGPPVSIPVPVRVPSDPAEDDRTEFLDDRTLLDPQVHGASTTPPPPPPRQSAPAHRRGERTRRRSFGGWFVGALVALILLAAAVIFASWIMERGEDGAAIPPAPELPEITPGISVEDPEPPSELDALINNQEGLRFYRAQNYAAALEQFRRAIAIAPSNVEYRHNYALTLLQLGLAGEAARELVRVVRQNPDYVEAHFNLAQARLAVGDTLDAIESLDRVLELSTDPRQQGIAQRRLQDVQRAMQSPAPIPADTASTADPPLPR